jgi:hypothetical protein
MHSLRLLLSLPLLVEGAFLEFNGPFGARTKQTPRALADNLRIIKTQPREPLTESGTFVTQLLMGNDEQRVYSWDSGRGISAIDAESLLDLYTVNNTESANCFALDASDSTRMRVQFPHKGQAQSTIAVREFDTSQSSAVEIRSSAFSVVVDGWGASGKERYARSCFAAHSAGMVFAAQTHDSADTPTVELYMTTHGPPKVTLLVAPPGCGLNYTIGPPILISGADGSAVVVLYMSCAGSTLPNTLVAFPLETVATPSAPLPTKAAWSFDVGFIEVSFSDYTFRAAGGVLVYQNHASLTVGGIDSASGKPLWVQPIATPADGVLSTSKDTCLVYHSKGEASELSALDAGTGKQRWVYTVRPGQQVLQQFAMLDPLGGASLLVWERSGRNSLIQLSPAGKEMQTLDLGLSTLPPNAADILVTSGGGAIVYLGSPARLVKLAPGGW